MTPSPAHKRSPKTVVSFLSGATSGCISTLALQPLDVVKTRMQMSAAYNRSIHLQPALTLQPNASAIDTFRGIIRQDRFTGLWRGVTPSVLRNTMSVGVYFMALNAITSRLSSPDGTISDVATLFSGASARCFSVILLCPLSVVKTRMETVEYARHYNGVIHAMRTIALQEGRHGLFSGLVPAIVRDVPFSAMYIFVYLRTKDFLGRAVGLENTRSSIMSSATKPTSSTSNIASATAATSASAELSDTSSSSSPQSMPSHQSPHKPFPNPTAHLQPSATTSTPPPPPQPQPQPPPPPPSHAPHSQQTLSRLVSFASGALGGGLATLLTQPQDVVKTRMQLSQQTRDGGTRSRYGGVLEAMRRVFREEGMYGFFRGASPRFMKRMLGSAITWMVFEETNQMYTNLLSRSRSESTQSR